MSLPTLLKPGSIVAQKWMTPEQKKKLTYMKSIDWIIEYLDDRSWHKKTPPKVKIRGPGSKVGVFRSGTGTGKSTVFPPAIYSKFFEELGNKKTIICTQPTIATATDIPYQIVAYNKNLTMGATIGFQTGSLVRKPVKGVLFATIGILLQHLKLLTDEEFMKKYSFIILDEIHLRSVETDTTLFYLRRFLERNYEEPDCPFIILTSGTFEPDIFMNYFKCPKDAFLDIIGSSFPIEDHYANFDVSDYISYAVSLAEKIHLENIQDITGNNIFRDILIFVQGGGQIADIVDRIHKLNTEVFSKGLEYAKKHSDEQQKKYKIGGASLYKPDTYYICPVAVTSDNMQKGGIEYQNVFSDIETVTVPIYKFVDDEKTDIIIEEVPASRRLIVATNAIETGLTIDTLKYCIDTGYVNESQFNPNYGVDVLITKNVTQASMRQRRGRVGRKDVGVFYTCYTQDTYKQLQPLPFSDIIRVDLTVSLLDIIMNETETTLIEIDKNVIANYPTAFQMNKFDQRWYALESKNQFNISNLIFIQSPSADSFTYALEKLRILGFIDHDYNPTLLGWYGSKFRRMDIENVRMILAGYHHGANILDLVTISCMLAFSHKLGIKKNKYTPRNPLKLSEAESKLYYQMVFTDDFIEYLFIWNDFMEYIAKLGYDLKSELSKSAKLNKTSFKLGGAVRSKSPTKSAKSPTKSAKSPTKSAKSPTKSAKSPTKSAKSPTKSRSKSPTKSPTKNKKLSKFAKLSKSAKLSKLDLIELVEKWCIENKLDKDTMLKIISARDDAIANLLNLGMNPFYNGLHLPRGKYNLVNILQNNLADGIDEIRKIKNCIYEGYRLNLYIWNEGIKEYISAVSHNKVKLDTKILKPLTLDNEIQQNRPQKIVVSSVMVRPGQNDSQLYEFNGADVCSLDGYVDVDIDFGNY